MFAAAKSVGAAPEMSAGRTEKHSEGCGAKHGGQGQGGGTGVLRQTQAERGGSQMVWSKDCSSAVVCGVGLLACNALLGSMGLIVRTGHDAMHKAPPAQHPLPETIAPDLLTANQSMQTGYSSGPDYVSLHWLSSNVFHTQELLAPIVCVMIFPFLLMDTASKSIYISGCLSAFRKTWRTLSTRLVWFAYAILAVYWLVVQSQTENESLASQLQHLSAAFPMAVASRRLLDSSVWGDCLLKPAVMLMRQPFKLIMPRLIFLSSVSAIVLMAVDRMTSKQQLRTGRWSKAGAGRDHSVLAALAAPVLLVSGPGNGAICALGLLEYTCSAELFQLLTGCCKCDADGTKLEPSRQGAWLGMAEGCMSALLSMQLFFCSAHFCEFAGLQYAAGNVVNRFDQNSFHVQTGVSEAAYCGRCFHMFIVCFMFER